MNLDIFSEKYNSILHPFHLENLDQLSVFIKNKNNHLPFKELKKETLEIISFLLENDIVYALEQNWMGNKEFKKTKLSNKDIIDKINNNWREDTSWEEFYFMLWFKFQDWYTTKLSAKGLTYYSVDWNKFINDKIGNLEQWIQDNKP